MQKRVGRLGISEKLFTYTGDLKVSYCGIALACFDVLISCSGKKSIFTETDNLPTFSIYNYNYRYVHYFVAKRIAYLVKITAGKYIWY